MNRQILEYKKVCLNCVKTDGSENIFLWEGRDDFNFKSPKASHEFESIYKLKKELSKQKKKCEYCSIEGKFEIWDLKIDSKSVYVKPTNNQPSATIKIKKNNFKSTPNIDVSGQVTVLMVEDFFNAILSHLRDYPDDMFLSKEDGVFIATLFFDLNTFQCFFNKFNFLGLSKDEIKTTLSNFKKSLIS